MPRRKSARGQSLARRPDWWPLPYYSRVLSEREWVGALAFRIALQAQWENGRDPLRSADAFRSLLVEDQRSLDEISSTFIGDEGLGVRSLSVFEAHLLSVANRTSDTDEVFDLAQAGVSFAKGGTVASPDFFESLKRSRKEAGHHPAIDAVGPRGFFDVLSSWVPCAVDLRLDDDTLMESFEIWLALQRSADRMKQTAGPITAKVREKWHRLQLLPAFDMLLWADIHGQSPTDAFMGRLLWPDESADTPEQLVDTTERYRKLVKPAIGPVFAWHTVEQLIRQLDAERIFENLRNLNDGEGGTKTSGKRSGKAVKLRSTGRELIPAPPSTAKKR